MFGECGVDEKVKMTLGDDCEDDGCIEMSWIERIDVDGSWTVLLLCIVV